MMALDKGLACADMVVIAPCPGPKGRLDEMHGSASSAKPIATPLYLDRNISTECAAVNCLFGPVAAKPGALADKLQE